MLLDRYRDDLVDGFRKGIPIAGLAVIYNVAETTIRDSFKRWGIPTRTRAEALLLWYSNSTSDERVTRCNHGRYDEVCIKRALVHERTKSRIGVGEAKMAKLLKERG